MTQTADTPTTDPIQSSDNQASQTDEEEILYCPWHPKVETTLRCYQCGTPICVKCANRTPVGYICPNCTKGRKQRFNQARTLDYVLASVVSLVLGGISAWILPSLGWFTIFLSPLSGVLIAEAVWWLVRRRYGEHLWWLVAGGIIAGALPSLATSLMVVVANFQYGGIFSALGLVWLIVHVVMAVGSATARLRLR
jgi:hypothetical protein